MLNLTHFNLINILTKLRVAFTTVNEGAKYFKYLFSPHLCVLELAFTDGLLSYS